MTNLNQHSVHYGTNFGVLGNVSVFLRSSGSPEFIVTRPNQDDAVVKRMRRRSRQHRLS